MFKKTTNLILACLIATGIISLSSCGSENSSSSSTSDTTFLTSGVKYVYLKEGNGRKVDSLTRVTTHINLMVGADTLWTTRYPTPQTFAFDAKRTSLIDGFDEVVMYAKAGDRLSIIIPPELGYKDKPNGDIPANSTLHFDIEFLDVEAPKTFLSDVLYPVFEESGMDGMIDHYQSMDLDSAEYRLEQQEWLDMSRKLFQSGAFQDVVKMWEFRLKEFGDVQSYYTLAQAQDRLGSVDEAIKSLQTCKEVVSDTTGMQFVDQYMADLQARK